MTKFLQKLSQRFNKLILDSENGLLEDEEQFEIDLMRPNIEPGLNAKWQALYIYYKRKSRIIPLLAFNIKVCVLHAHLIVESKYLPFIVKIPLISINYIESDEELEKLDIRGQNFQLIMWKINAESIEELREWLRFLVVRQRIPHSILGLPFDWETPYNSKSGPKIKFKWPMRKNRC